MEQPSAETLPIKQGLVLDILDTNAPALSSTSDMPVIETKPDSSPPKEVAKEVEKAATEEVKTPVETATAATEEQPGADHEEDKKPPRGVQKRLDELTKQREDEKRRAEAAERRLDEMLKRIPAETVKTDAVAEQELARPNRADFNDDASYFDALGDYSDQKAEKIAKREIQATIERQNKEAQENAIAEGQRIARESYLGRVGKTQEKYADFKEVAESPDVTVSIPMAHAIVHHEQGPEIQYYLGKNPDDAARIAKLDVPSQLVELGIIVATKLSASPAAEVAKPIPAKQISAAPKPLTPAKASEDTSSKPLDELDMDSYVAKRKQQMAARH